jgi:hypothetical protein
VRSQEKTNNSPLPSLAFQVCGDEKAEKEKLHEENRQFIGASFSSFAVKEGCSPTGASALLVSRAAA